MTTTTKDFIERQQAQAGREIGVSPWITLSQDMVNQFADLTGDPQFIHVDPSRAAAETPFGGTIVHGFFVLSLAVQMAEACLEAPQGQKMNLNYGFDKVRFIDPVRVGSRVRGRFTLISATEKNPGQVLNKMGLTVEVEGNDKPALVAEWLGMSIL